jgi:serine phosphatase RsbU (regulator of sigma subunit)/CHASE3 domain sensor protein
VLLRRRLLVLLAFVVVSVLVLGIAAQATIRNRDAAVERGRRADVARELVAQLDAALADQETGQRGFLLAGSDEFLEPYQEGQRDETRLARALRDQMNAFRGIEGRLDDLVVATERWRSDAAEPEIALRRAGDVTAVQQSVRDGGGKRLFDAVRARSDALAAAVVSEARAADAERTDAIRLLTLFVVVIIVIVLIAIGLAAWLIRSWVTRPIDALVSDVRRIRDGALDAPIRADGPPEIAELATAVDSMRTRINRAREAVEQNASVVLALRSQLEPDVGELPEDWTIAAQLRAAEGVVAGDCFDVVRTPGGHLALVVVDIAGHGATEGILALRCKELLRASLAVGSAPGDAIAAVADQLGDMGPEVFLTTFVATIDTADGSIRYANAGHPPAYVCAEDAVAELGPTGPLVGLLGGSWGTARAAMAPGDNLCAYTDGLVEVRNAEREFFGPERLVDLIRGARCDEAPAIVKRVLDEVELFAPGRLHDDATIVVLCRAAAGPVPALR